jgi:hypothetical protein
MVKRLNTSDAAPSITLIDIEGTPTPLGDLFAGRKTLLTFLRHFG